MTQECVIDLMATRKMIIKVLIAGSMTIKIIVPSERKYSVWIGGSKLLSQVISNFFALFVFQRFCLFKFFVMMLIFVSLCVWQFYNYLDGDMFWFVQLVFVGVWKCFVFSIIRTSVYLLVCFGCFWNIYLLACFNMYVASSNFCWLM